MYIQFFNETRTKYINSHSHKGVVMEIKSIPGHKDRLDIIIQKADLYDDAQIIRSVKGYGTIIGPILAAFGYAKKITDDNGKAFYVNKRSLGKAALTYNNEPKSFE